MNADAMIACATYFRAAQLYAHNAHNLAKGPSFFSDHEFLGELYPVYEAAYDRVVERIIGLGGTPDLVQLARDAADQLDAPADLAAAFRGLAKAERDLRACLATAIPGATPGTQNLLQDLAAASEARSYQLNRRISS